MLTHVSHLVTACTFTFTERDAILYALSVGCNESALDAAELPYTYELHPEGLSVLPTFGVLFAFESMGAIISVRWRMRGR